MSAPKFPVGTKVNHVANSANPSLFPAGCGTVTAVTPWNTADGYSYQVKCDVSGSVLPVNFKESELSCV